MAEYRKCPFQEFALSPEYPDFKGISICTPARSSFYLSIGIAFIESLIRLKLDQQYADPVWQVLDTLKSKALEYAARNNWEGQISDWLTVLNTIKSLPIDQALEYFARCIEQYYTQSIDLMMRCYFCAMMTGKTNFIDKVLSMEPYDPNDVNFLDNFVSHFKVHLFIISQNDGKILKTAQGKRVSALVCLFADANNLYYIAYHQQHLNVDTNNSRPREGELPFPLLFADTPEYKKFISTSMIPNMATPEIQRVSPTGQVIPESTAHLVQEMARFLTQQGNNEWGKLKATITQVISEYPSLNSGYLKQLMEMLAKV